jgi:hypothetical protein
MSEIDGGRDVVRRRELADFLRARRAAVQPEDVGLRPRGRRLVPGLRRHEVSDLAGVSLTWYTWLEQGRDIRTSPQVLDAIARALRLDDATRRHFRRLAGAPVVDPSEAAHVVDPMLVAVLDDLLPAPAYVMTPANDILAWNDAFVELFGDPAALPGNHRNALRVLLSDVVRQRLVDWELEARETIARFRAEASKYPGDARCEAVVEELLEESDLFRDAWATHEVQAFVRHTQDFQLPEIGTVRTQVLQLRPVDQPSLILMVHRPDDDESRWRLAQLLGRRVPAA